MTKPRCPSCGSHRVIPIVYGMPGAELAEASERGEVQLGGCVVTDHDPVWHCKACAHDWRESVTRPPYHQHIGDPGVGDSTHCICHVLKNPPPGGCGRVHCVNREGRSEEKTESELRGNSMTKTSQILLSTTGPEDWQQFLAQPDKHWRAGYSAWALAHCWEAAAGLPAEIEKLLVSSTTTDLHDVELLIALPEYAVDLPGGDQASMNDVFVLGRTSAGTVTIMVEGKVNESFGPLVKDWGPDSSPVKKERWD